MSNERAEIRRNESDAASRIGWLYLLSSAAAVITGLAFLIAAVAFFFSLFQSGADASWLASVQNNWLELIIKLHANLPGVQETQLYQLNLLDISLMTLIGFLFIGLYAALRRTSKIWAIVALVQPFIGIVLFIATHSAGRSAILTAVATVSIIMLRSEQFGKPIGWVGILAGVLLLAGDIGLSMIHSLVLAVLTGVGYVGLTTWLFWSADHLYRLGKTQIARRS